MGDRFQLRRRQREALRRASCTDGQRRERGERMRSPADLAGSTLLVDGFNVIITVEAALSGAAVFLCRDGCLRDIASIHGSYRQVDETRRALEACGALLEAAGIRAAEWLLDSLVSNSGRLANMMRTLASEHGWDWDVRLVKNPDAELVEREEPVATSDAPVLDRCGAWCNLAREVVGSGVPESWIVDLVKS